MNLPSKDKQWKTIEVDSALAAELASELGIPESIGSILVARGFKTAEDAEKFLNPRLSALSDPFEIDGMMLAVERTWDAIEKDQKIVVYGDYDVDGVTSTALLSYVLRGVGGKVSTFLPNRFEDGYGFGIESVKRCMDAHKPDLIITVDCGTCSTEAVEFASASGVDVIVTDHHDIAGDLAPALAVINPKKGNNSEIMPLAGVGVAFKFCHGLIKHGLNTERKAASDIDLRDFLDLVAIGTIADVVPMVGENRVLTKYGLAQINKNDGSNRAGLKALMKIGGISSAVDNYHIGFIIGPRINAPGRVASPDPSLELLLADNAADAEDLALKLEEANKERKRIEAEIFNEASREIEETFDENLHFGVVAGKEGWHTGTIGIAAARLCRRYERPAVVIGFDADGQGRGSCRSVQAINIVEVLKKCSDLLVTFGGHKMAAGLTIEKGNLDAFRLRFNELCSEALKESGFVETKELDAWVALRDADKDLLDAINMLKPFGTGNSAPVWGAKDLTIVGQPRIVGKSHLKLTLASGGTQMNAIAFGMGNRDIPDGSIDIIFRLEENTYMGYTSLQLNINDFRASS